MPTSSFAHASDDDEPDDKPVPTFNPDKLAMAKLLHIPYSPHQPYLKQARFLLDFSKEALYGGAVGGGKSDALLMGALQFIDVPGYAAILFRRSYSDLSQPGALMDRAREWFTRYKVDGVRWSEIEHKWTFPSGATVSFAYLDKVNDHLKYQGAEFHYVAFDELTQFKEKQYRYLFSRIRKPDDGSPLSRVPLRIRGGTNPGGPGHHWVYMRFVKPWEDWHRARHQWATTPPDQREILGLSEPAPMPPEPHFHPATIDDNPFLNTLDYEESLDKLDHFTKAQLRKGDWQIKPDGRMFKRTWFEIIPEAPSDCRWVRWWDLAATDDDPDKDPDYTAGCLMGMTPQGIVVIKHMVRLRRDPHEVEATVKQTALADGHGVPVGMEQEPGSSGKTVTSYYRRVVLAGWQFHGVPSSGSKIERAKPLAGRAGKGDVKLVAGTWIPDFLDEVEIFPDGEHDDQVDAAASGYLYLTRGATGLGGGLGGSTDGSSGGGGLNFGTDDLSGDNPWRSLGEGGSSWAA